MLRPDKQDLKIIPTNEERCELSLQMEKLLTSISDERNNKHDEMLRKVKMIVSSVEGKTNSTLFRGTHVGLTLELQFDVIHPCQLALSSEIGSKREKNPNSQWALNPGTLYSLPYTLPLELPLVDVGILDTFFLGLFSKIKFY